MEEKSGGVEQSSTTEFVNDALVKETSIVSGLPDAFTRLSQVMKDQTIETFLKRPIVIRKSTFTTTDLPAGTGNIYHPQDIIANAIYLDKLDGFLGFRGTLVLRLQVNATKFQQGRYMLAYIPVGGARVTGVINQRPGDTWLAQHIAFLTQRTQLPHVDIDLNCDTEVTMRIPYSSALDYYPMPGLADINRYGCQGVIKIFPYSALETGSGDNYASYTLWAHFEDVELVGAALAQSGAGETPSQTEQKIARIGPITSTAMKISMAGKSLSYIPKVGPIAMGVSWAADIVAAVAGVFGWNKPSNVAPACRMRDELGLYSSNIDAADNSLPLSMSLKAEVKKDDMIYFSDTDEMDIVSFVSRPAWFRTVVWTDTATYGTELDKWFVSPTTNVKVDVVGSMNTYSYTPCQYIASNFAFWRGSMVYKFKIVKTGFHSGRIAVVYSPIEARTTNLALSYDNSHYVYREVIDIRESNEFTLTIPYMNSRPYKTVSDVDQTYGYLAIYVVDQLVSPDTVPSNITMLVEHCMTSDAEFYCPKWRPALPNADIVEAQMDNTCSLINTNISNTVSPRFQLETSTVSVGERILSLRALSRRFFHNEPYGATPTTQSSIYHNFLPFAWPLYDEDHWSSVKNICGDFYAQMCMIFNYSRGGVRLKFMNNGNTSYGITSFLEPLLIKNDFMISPHFADVSTFNNAEWPGTSMCGTLNYAFSHPDNSKVTEIQIPMYSSTRMRCNADHVASATVPYFNEAGSLATPVSVSCTQTQVDRAVSRENISGSFLRACADDADFGGFVSIPPLVLG